MDNASKALIISGAVLISILLLTTGVYVVNTQKPELFAKNASDKMWDGVNLGMGLPGGVLPEGWETIEKPAEWTSTKVTAIKENATGKIVPLPDGYQISKVKDEQTVEGGLVITDGENEFVWIPVKTAFSSSYEQGQNLEPRYLTFDCDVTKAVEDSQATIDYFYGKKTDGSSYYTIDINYADTKDRDKATNTVKANGTTFDYGHHYYEMVTSVNKYDGFYIGRYETTIDGNNVGSKAGATVISADISLAQTNNKPCRWWGLYAVQRNANVAGNGNTVQTNMIWGQQWDAMITFFGDKDYSATTVSKIASDWGKQVAGGTKYKYMQQDGTETLISDEICNIYDLRGNLYDWTGEAPFYTNARIGCGGRGNVGSVYCLISSASRKYNPYSACSSVGFFGSRMSLYIKD